MSWPKIPSGFVRATLAGHSALGLFFAGLMYLVCISGTVVVFQEEIANWEQPGIPAGQPSDEAVASMFDEAIAREAASGLAPVHSIGMFTNGEQPTRTIVNVYRDDGSSENWYADPETGALLEERKAHFAEYLSNLHIYLRLPAPWGIYLVGLIGVAMLSLVVSGILAHPRIFRDAFHFRRGGSQRVQEADVHNRLSIWALPFHLVISFTGAFLGLSFLVVSVLAMVAYEGDQDAAIRAVLGPQPTEDHEPAPIPDLPMLLADARERTGLSDIAYLRIEHPLTKGQVLYVTPKAPEDLSAGEDLYYSASGEFIDRSGSMDGSIGPQTLAALGPLHFGNFGGYWTKFAYIIFGLASTGVVITGVSIWLARRAAKGKPAPKWERIWLGTVWGGALGCSLPGLFIPVSEGLATTVLLVALIGGMVLALFLPTPKRASQVLRGGLAASLLALIIQNMTQYGALAFKDQSLLVNTALLLVALGLAVSVIRDVRNEASRVGDRKKQESRTQESPA